MPDAPSDGMANAMSVLCTVTTVPQTPDCEPVTYETNIKANATLPEVTTALLDLCGVVTGRLWLRRSTGRGCDIESGSLVALDMVGADSITLNSLVTGATAQFSLSVTEFTPAVSPIPSQHIMDIAHRKFKPMDLFSGKYDEKTNDGVIAVTAQFRGLVNQAMTCYLNSLLQTLYMTPEFRNAIYSWEFNDNCEAFESIPYQLQRLFLGLQFSSKRSVETVELTRSFGWVSSDAWQQHDVQELCRVMFEALETAWQGTSQATLIQKLYQGKMRDYVRCLTCGTESARTDDFLDIPLVVKPFGATKSYDSIMEALSGFVAPETLSDGNQYFCSHCNQKSDALKGLEFSSFPPLLTIQLKRFDYDYNTMQRIKLNDRIEFPFVLNLKQFVVGDSTGQSLVYRLYSIMVHSGSASGGHYFVYIYSFTENRWYCFNDQRVWPVTEEDVTQTYGTGGRWSSAANAYMLVYRQIVKDEDGADFLAELPEHLQQEANQLRAAEQAAAEEAEQEKQSLKVQLRHNDGPTEAWHCRRQSTLSRCILYCRRHFKCEDVDVADCRLVKVNHLTLILEESFHGTDEMPNPTLEDLLGGDSSTYSILLMFETKLPTESWTEVEHGGLTFYAFQINDWQLTHRCYLWMPPHATVACLKEALRKRLAIDENNSLNVCIQDAGGMSTRHLYTPDVPLALTRSRSYSTCRLFFTLGDDESTPFKQTQLYKVSGSVMRLKTFTLELPLEFTTVTLNNCLATEFSRSVAKSDGQLIVEIDQQCVLSDLKDIVSAVLGIPTIEFKFHRYMGTELRRRDLPLIESSADLKLVLGTPLLENQHRCRAYHLSEADTTALTPPSDPLDLIVVDEETLGDIKKRILQMVLGAEYNEEAPIQLRVATRRHLSMTGFTKIDQTLNDEECVNSNLLYTDFKEIWYHSTTEQAPKYSTVVYLQEWLPELATLGKMHPVALVVGDVTLDAVKKFATKLIHNRLVTAATTQPLPKSDSGALVGAGDSPLSSVLEGEPAKIETPLIEINQVDLMCASSVCELYNVDNLHMDYRWNRAPQTVSDGNLFLIRDNRSKFCPRENSNILRSSTPPARQGVVVRAREQALKIHVASSSMEKVRPSSAEKQLEA